MIRFFVSTEPVAKARARTVVQKGRVHFFTPRSTEVAEWEIRQTYLRVAAECPNFLHGPVELDVTIYVRPPMGLPKYKLGRVLPEKRPDVDNYVKLCLDALRGVAWRDDSQIVDLRARKRYAWDARVGWAIALGPAEVPVAPEAGPERVSRSPRRNQA